MEQEPQIEDKPAEESAASGSAEPRLGSWVGGWTLPLGVLALAGLACMGMPVAGNFSGVIKAIIVAVGIIALARITLREIASRLKRIKRPKGARFQFSLRTALVASLALGFYFWFVSIKPGPALWFGALAINIAGWKTFSRILARPLGAITALIATVLYMSMFALTVILFTLLIHMTSYGL